MTLVRFSPARRLINMRSDMDRLFEDFFRPDLEDQEEFGGLRPLVNMEETDNDYRITADLPGISKDDIKITYQDGILSVSGEKKAAKDVKDGNYHRYERRFGKFCRNIEIPTNIVTEKIGADYSDGVLSITLPKAEEVKPKQIQVKVK
jgi:HSP20 family protein